MNCAVSSTSTCTASGPRAPNRSVAGLPGAGQPGRRQRGPADPRRWTWRWRRGVGGSRHRPLAHLVRQPGRRTRWPTYNGIPHVLSAHSLEPQRPWKAEQLGGVTGLVVAERQAYERSRRRNHRRLLRHAGRRAPRPTRSLEPGPGARDPQRHRHRARYRRRAHSTERCWPGLRHRPRPSLRDLRRTDHPAEGAEPPPPAPPRHFDPAIQLVLCAGAPDTPQIAAETEAAVAGLARARAPAWSGSARCCPPPRDQRAAHRGHRLHLPVGVRTLGIVNLEAMACETAVVASAIGGIPEVVADGLTGSLVHYDADDPAGLPGRIGRGGQRI